MAYSQKNNYIQTNVKERLFLNLIRFDFPSEPVTFYFSRKKDRFLKDLNHILFPVGVESIFPDVKKGETIYTSFTEEREGMIPLDVNLSDHKNYYLAKRYYNGEICHYLKTRGLPVEMNHITKDNQAWVFDRCYSKRKDCWQYDRFTIKVDYDDFNKKTQLVLTYDRPTLVYQTSVGELLETAEDPFSDSGSPTFTLDYVKRVLYVYKRKDGKDAFIIDKYSEIAKRSDFDPYYAYPIMWPKLADFIGYEEQEEDDGTFKQKSESRYKKYYEKIKFFYNAFLNNESFRSIVNISTEGFTDATKLQIGHTTSESKVLEFGNNVTDFNPQHGVNSGPYKEPLPTNIQLIFLFHEDDTLHAQLLLRYFVKEGYKKVFEGLKKYTGKSITFAPKGKHLTFKSKSNPLPELREFLQNFQKSEDATYMAVYMTPHSKHTNDKQAKKIYYKVKKELLDYGMTSQCIETSKMVKVLEEDNGTDRYGRPKANFAYTLQNMAIAMNAKLGGIPWRIKTETFNELIIGIGAFKTGDTQYIGSAFSFENTGIFNSFEYFLKGEIEELAGSIEEAIINFTKVKGKPERLIIHYYKVMSYTNEYEHIEKRLKALDLDIPVYIVTINKTESEDKVLFDAECNEFMPYSGRYVNLGQRTYLLCNNTRYENCRHSAFDGYPFPVKLKIDCPYYDGEIDGTTIKQLIDQVYQFSRIYWKSVKQQNLPVTIKYPEMVAEMAPNFDGESVPEEFENRLWFL